MKMFKSIDKLEEKLTEIIKKTEKERVKSITAYQYIITSYYSVFN